VDWARRLSVEGTGARLIRNECEGFVSQRRHARFRPLAYAARSMPRGSIGSPPERGTGVYADRSGHVSALGMAMGTDMDK
jgi:hypothetical protein